MKKLKIIILSILCTTSFFLHSSTHEELLHYDLSQRKATQKLVKAIRNVTGMATLMGLISYIYIGNRQSKQMNSALARLHSIGQEDQQPRFEPSTPLPFYLRIPIALSALGLLPSLGAFLTSALYGAYNSLQIEALENELSKLINKK